MIGILLGSHESCGKRGLCPRWVRALANHGMNVVAIKSGQDDAYYENILDVISGVLLPGGDTDVYLEGYDYNQHDTQPEFDIERDKTACFLAQYCAEHSIPILGICRGMQEMNVAIGGSIRAVHNHDYGYIHREKRESEVHNIILEKEGLLKKINPHINETIVNSIHRYGITPQEQSERLKIEAWASDDDIIEAFSLPDHPFFLGVQFHAEFSSTHGLNEAIIQAFGEAARKYSTTKGYSYCLLDPTFQMLRT